MFNYLLGRSNVIVDQRLEHVGQHFSQNDILLSVENINKDFHDSILQTLHIQRSNNS